MTSGYDPQPDLDRLRLRAGAWYAPAFLGVAALFELSVYLSAVTSLPPDILPVRLFVHAKVLLMLASAYAVHRATKLEPTSRWLVPAMAAAMLLASCGYLALTFLRYGGMTSCFSLFVPSVSFFSLLTSPPFRTAATEAAAARARLEAEGLDGF